jgi:hypothetical protein
LPSNLFGATSDMLLESRALTLQAVSSFRLRHQIHTFFLKELQRAHQDLRLCEENLHTAARLGEQLITYNEELEAELLEFSELS